jgi:hypothetical protein
MKPEIKEKWIAALKSGEYQKGVDSLRQQVGEGEFRHCCLGVLCELHMKETGEGQWSENNVYGTTTGSERDWLPTAVQKWAGIDTSGGKFDPDPEDIALRVIEEDFGHVKLSFVNDARKGKLCYDPTFNTVIKYIEKYF